MSGLEVQGCFLNFQKSLGCQMNFFNNKIMCLHSLLSFLSTCMTCFGGQSVHCAGSVQEERARAHNPPPGGTIRTVFGPETSNAIRAAHIESKRDMCNSKYNTIFTVITTDI